MPGGSEARSAAGSLGERFLQFLAESEQARLDRLPVAIRPYRTVITRSIRAFRPGQPNILECEAGRAVIGFHAYGEWDQPVILGRAVGAAAGIGHRGLRAQHARCLVGLDGRRWRAEVLRDPGPAQI